MASQSDDHHREYLKRHGSHFYRCIKAVDRAAESWLRIRASGPARPDPKAEGFKNSGFGFKDHAQAMVQPFVENLRDVRDRMRGG